MPLREAEGGAMLKKILVVILLVIAAALVYASTRPDTMHVERSVSINAPAERVFPLINDFRQWPLWSPWEQLDPAMTRTVSGAPTGRGAIYEWQGNSDVGSGRMEITNAAEPSNVTIQLDFLEPWEAHNVTEFRLESSGPTTNVTWTMDGPSPFMMKVMSLFTNMDTMIGDDFEKGLASLKAEAEK